jgi:hypothetical protein
MMLIGCYNTRGGALAATFLGGVQQQLMILTCLPWNETMAGVRLLLDSFRMMSMPPLWASPMTQLSLPRSMPTLDMATTR